MNSWIGGGLSSLRGQLTHLITEGTQDGIDASTELVAAKRRISDLEDELRGWRHEVDSLRARNDELAVRLQSEEMLMHSVTDSLRERLARKEEVIEGLSSRLSVARGEPEGRHRSDSCGGDLKEDQTGVPKLWCSSTHEEALSRLLEEQRQEMELEHGADLAKLQAEVTALRRRLESTEDTVDGTGRMSQTSDASDVSLRSRALRHQVQSLGKEIDRLATIDGPQGEGGGEEIGGRIERLQERLMRRRERQNEQSCDDRLIEDLDEDEPYCITDSVEENSSDNSTVEGRRSKTKPDAVTAFSDEIVQLYGLLVTRGNGESAVEIAQLTSDVVNEMMASAKELLQKVKDGKTAIETLENVYRDLVSDEDGHHQINEDEEETVNEMVDRIRLFVMEIVDGLRQKVRQFEGDIGRLMITNDELLKKNADIDGQLLDMSITIARYEGIERVVNDYQQQISSMHKEREGSHKMSLGMDSADILEHVETFNREKDELIEQLEGKIVSLQSLLEEKDDVIRGMDADRVNVVFEYDASIAVLNSELDSVQQCLDKSRENEHGIKKENDALVGLLKEKEEMIRSLNEELTMLSTITNGVMVSREIQTEDEWTQEEIRRLEAVVETQAGCLGRYETRINELESTMTTASVGNDDEMAREAVEQLSGMVRDKQWEVDALRAKNSSLLEVIKGLEEGNNVEWQSSALVRLVDEKEVMSKELQWYRENREQLVETLNRKHDESVKYHGEIQRLVAFINGEQGKWQQAGTEMRRLQEKLERVEFDLEESRLQTAELTSTRDGLEQEATIWNSGVLVEGGCRECDRYAMQVEEMKSKEQKLLKEKQLFQEHLIRVEESYTQEATVAEDREVTLRRQLHDAEDLLAAIQADMADLKVSSDNSSVQLQLEIRHMAAERDEYIRRLADTEHELHESTQGLQTLQGVLERFQADQAADVAFQRERLQQEAYRAIAERDAWQMKCNALQATVESQTEAVEAAQRLADQIERREEQLAAMQAQLAVRDETIDGFKMQIRQLQTVTESKVDKVLMRNLLVGYFHAPDHRRQEALRVIGSILQLSDSDYRQIGVDTKHRSRWFSWLRPPISEDGTTTDAVDRSFTDLFISFLERESTPLPSMRLPTGQVAAEARQHSSLSQSDELSFLSLSSPASTSSPVVTKRNGSPSRRHSSSSSRQPPQLLNDPYAFVYMPDVDRERSSEHRQAMPNHRRVDSGRNALLSLLDQ